MRCDLSKTGMCGAVCRQMLRLQSKPLSGALEHSARSSDLCLTDGARGLHIEDDRVLGIDQIVRGIGEEGMPLVSAGPLGCWV